MPELLQIVLQRLFRARLPRFPESSRRMVSAETAHLCIDIQNYYLQQEDPEEARRWAPFVERMHRTVIPNTARLIAE